MIVKVKIIRETKRHRADTERERDTERETHREREQTTHSFTTVLKSVL